MKKLSSKDIRHLVRNPRAMAKFQATGRFESPSGPERVPPLLLLLRQLPGRIAADFRHITLGSSLGFQYVQRPPFRDANSIKHWLEDRVTSPGPGCYVPGFRGPVTLNDLHAASKQAPDMAWLQAHFPQLCRRPKPQPAPDDGPTP